MGIGWVFLIRGEAGSYRIFVWIVLYRWLDRIISAGLDCIVLAVSYRIGWIVSYWMGCIRKHCLLCAGWLLAGWDGWTGWDIGGMGVVCTNVSRRLYGSGTIGTGMGAPPLALEGRQAVGSGSWYQLRWCCKGADYLCQRS